MRPFRRTQIALITLGCGLAVTAFHLPAAAQATHFEYRVVFASALQLARQLEAAGRDGYVCAAVARPDPGVAVPGVVVVLGRPTGNSHPAVMHRVITGGFMGTDLQAPLDQAGAAGFHLCGVVLDEGSTARPALVAVMSQTAGAPAAVRYGVEVLTNYKESLVRLTAAARDGFVPIAAAPVSNNRVPDMRSWMVVTERSDQAAAREVAVRSASGAGTLERALNDQGKQGFRVDLAWKEGNDVVALMSRLSGDARSAHAYAAESRSADSFHSLSGLYLGDFPDGSAGARLVISDRSQPASTDVEEDPLPKLGSLGYAEAGALGTLGDHLSRHHGFAPALVRIRRAQNGTFAISTVLSQRGK